MNTLMLKQPSPTTHGFSPSPSSLMSKKDGHFSSTSPSSSSDSINEDNLSTKEIRKTKNYSINSLLCSDKNCHKSLSPELDDDNSSEDIKNDNNQITENATIENRLNSSKKENEAVVASPSFLPQLAPFLLQFPTTALQMPGISANSIPNISGVDPISLSNLAASMANAGNGAEAQSQQFQNMYLTYMNLMNQFAGSQLATSPLRLISPATLPTMPDSSRTQPTQHPQSNVLNPFGFLSQLPQHVMTSNGLTTSLANSVFHQNDAFQHHNNHLQLSPNSMLLNKKQSRPTFTGHQIFMLEKKFEQTKYLAGSDRAQLAQELNMSESQVKVWFQNRRTKWRKKEAADNAIIRKENGTRASESPMNRADSQSPMEQIEALESTNPLLVATCNGNLIV